MSHLARSILIIFFLGVLAIPGQLVVAQSQPTPAPAVSVGANPTDVAVNSATHTAYVTNGGDNTVSVFDTSNCRAGKTTGCQSSVATITVGNGPVFAAVNQTTDTVYVTNTGDNTVSVINGATCNASVQTGCGAVPPVVQAGINPDYAAVDEATDTIYVSNANNGGPDPGTVSVINGNRCNAMNISGCGQAPATVTVGVAPGAVAYDSVNHTVYVSNFIAGGSGTLSLIDASNCNANTVTGCSQSPSTITVVKGAAWVAVDQYTDTVYVAGGPTGAATNLGFVSIINGSHCNAHDTSGCSAPQPAITVGSVAIGIVVDQQTHSVFVANQEDSTVSVVDGAVCNAQVTRGCDQTAPSITVPFDPGTPGLDAATGTLYVPSQNANSVSVLDVMACTLTHPYGCRQAAPTSTVGTAPQGIAADPSTGTIYVGNRSDNNLSVINGRACNALVTVGCKAIWPTVAVGVSPQAIAFDAATRTVYTANNSGTVSVLDATHCNALVQSGCGQQAHTVTISATPHRLRSIAVDGAVHTVYVTDGPGNDLAMIDTNTCNGTTAAGCSQSPSTVATGNFPDGLAIDPTTQTVYVANWHSGTVTVIDATTCNAVVHTGCSATHPTVTVGMRPNLLVVDGANRTVYVANADSGTVSMIDATVCNARNVSGCGQTFPTIPVSSPTIAQGAPSPFAVGIDPARNLLYITDIVDSNVMVVDTATCNGTLTTGCAEPLAEVSTGGWPANLAIDPFLDTAYVPDNVDGLVSVVRLVHPTRTGTAAQGLITQTSDSLPFNSFTVWFSSSVPGQGEVLFGSGPGCSGLVETATQDEGAGTTTHTVNVTGNDLPGTVGDNGIIPGATYWYEAVTVTKTGVETDNNDGKCYSVTVPTM